VFGVFVFGRTIDQLIFMYCVECMMVGLFNALEMIFARKKYDRSHVVGDHSEDDLISEGTASKKNLIIFFSVLYFLLIVGFSKIIFHEIIHMENVFTIKFNFPLVLIAMFVGYLANFYSRYIMTGIYKRTDAADLFYVPFRRLWILCAIIFSSQILLHRYTASINFYLAVMITAKLPVDLITHYYYQSKDAYVD
jgi:hypothetical protein